jgi:hypothetical protein
MKKLSKLYEEISSECDGCQYFDMESIYDNVEFEKPLYALVAKRRTGEIVYLTPKQYIHKIAMGFGGLSYEDALTAYNSDTGEKYSEAMKSGSKFPVGHYTIGSGGQEGRHRAMAAMKLGANKIPVIEFKNIDRAEFISYVKKFKDKSFDELNQFFISNGTKGITKLGFNDLQRFIDYNSDDLIEPQVNNSRNVEKGDKLNKIFKELD